MKKLVFFMLFAISAMAASAQSSTNSAVRDVQNVVKRYLQNEGYQPTIDSDGDLKFKREGQNCWVIISKESDGYYYFVTQLSGISVEDDDVASAILAADRVTREKKVGKCCLNKEQSSVLFRIESFYQNASQYTNYLSRFLNILSQMKGDFKEYYDDYK